MKNICLYLKKKKPDRFNIMYYMYYVSKLFNIFIQSWKECTQQIAYRRKSWKTVSTEVLISSLFIFVVSPENTCKKALCHCVQNTMRILTLDLMQMDLVGHPPPSPTLLCLSVCLLNGYNMSIWKRLLSKPLTICKFFINKCN